MKPELNKNNSNLNATLNKDEKAKESKPNPSPKKEDKKKETKPQKGKEENPPQEEEQIPEPVTKLDLKENTIVIYRVLDVIFKCYPNLAYSHKKGISLRKVMKKYSYDEYPTFSASEVKKEGMMNIKYLSSDLKKRSSNDINLMKDLSGVNSNKEEKEEKGKKDKKKKNENHYTTQRKDIFYNSFKNIKERHKYKEDRINLLNHQNKKIVNELKDKNGNKKKKK